MIWLIVGTSVIVIGIGCFYLDARAYRQGFRAGCRHQQQAFGDDLKRQLQRLESGRTLAAERRMAAERNLDYLYERTRQRIGDVS
jgi:hypothetical protein